jgi:hypothetical protein
VIRLQLLSVPCDDDAVLLRDRDFAFAVASSLARNKAADWRRICRHRNSFIDSLLAESETQELESAKVLEGS